MGAPRPALTAPAQVGMMAGMKSAPVFQLLVVLSLAGAAAVPHAARAQERTPEVTSEVTQEGDFISVTAIAEVALPRALAYAVLTDYEHYPDFIPELHHSRVLLRQGTGLVLEQRGIMKFLFFSQPIDLQLAVVESAPNRVISRALGGNLRGFSGRYELQVVGSGVRISYSARFIPSFVLPEVLGTFIVRNVFVRAFEATLEEMQRRHAKAGGVPVPSARAPAGG